MGRKHKLCHRKNNERKRQSSRKNRPGRPSRKNRSGCSSKQHPLHQTTNEKCPLLQNTDRIPALPQGWTFTTNIDLDLVTVSKLAIVHQKPLTTHSVVIDKAGNWKLFVHSQEVKNNELINSLPNPIGQVEMVKTMIIERIEHLNFCPSHPDQNFVEMLKQKKGVVKSNVAIAAKLNDYSCVYMDGVAYDITVRPVKCTCKLLLPSGASRCDACDAYRLNLRAIYSNFQRRSAGESARCQSNSKAN